MEGCIYQTIEGAKKDIYSYWITCWKIREYFTKKIIDFVLSVEVFPRAFFRTFFLLIARSLSIIFLPSLIFFFFLACSLDCCLFFFFTFFIIPIPVPISFLKCLYTSIDWSNFWRFYWMRYCWLPQPQIIDIRFQLKNSNVINASWVYKEFLIQGIGNIVND